MVQICVISPWILVYPSFNLFLCQHLLKSFCEVHASTQGIQEDWDLGNSKIICLSVIIIHRLQYLWCLSQALLYFLLGMVLWAAIMQILPNAGSLKTAFNKSFDSDVVCAALKITAQIVVVRRTISISYLMTRFISHCQLLNWHTVHL